MCGGAFVGPDGILLRNCLTSLSTADAVELNIRVSPWEEVLSRTASQYQHVHSEYTDLKRCWYVLDVHSNAVLSFDSAILSSWSIKT